MCFTSAVPGAQCTISNQGVAQDPRSGAVVFQTSCDPLGANRFGTDIFVMRADGSGLRQLTRTRGMVLEPDGGAEMPAREVAAQRAASHVRTARSALDGLLQQGGAAAQDAQALNDALLALEAQFDDGGR